MRLLDHLLAAALALGAGTAHAYTTFDGAPRWGSGAGTTITWSLMPEGAPFVPASATPPDVPFLFADFWSGGNDLGAVYAQLDPDPTVGRTLFRQALTGAFATWSAVADVHFVEVPDDGSPLGFVGATAGKVGDIRIGAYGFLAPFDAIGGHSFEPPGGSSALAAYWAGTNQQSDFGDVNLNAFALFSTFPGLGEGQAFPYFANDLQGLLTHEIGHALGLGHPEADGLTGTEADTIMYVGAGCCGTLRRTLGADDIAGIQALYGVPAAAVPEPGSGALVLAGLALLWTAARRRHAGAEPRRARETRAAGTTKPA